MTSTPFSKEQFFAVFAAYNETVWPAQWYLSAAGLLALGGVLSQRELGARLTLATLGVLWLWMGIVYHLLHFAVINPAAYAFAVLFAIEGCLFFWRAARPVFALRLVPSYRSMVGIGLAVCGLFVYPLLNQAFGHVFPAAPGFGLPCPTTLFTLGILSLARPNADRLVLIIPVVWSMIGSTAAFTLGVPQDYALVLAALWGIFLIVKR